MNDFSELESELKQLRPKAPSVELSRRIEQALNAPATSTPTAGVLPRRDQQPRFRWFFLGLGAAAAAALVMLARVSFDMPVEPQQRIAKATSTPAAAATRAAGDTFVPEGFSRVVYNQQDEGLFYPDETAEAPVRRVRSSRQETLAWRNPQTGASLRVSYPVEEVRLIPVSGH